MFTLLAILSTLFILTATLDQYRIYDVLTVKPMTETPTEVARRLVAERRAVYAETRVLQGLADVLEVPLVELKKSLSQGFSVMGTTTGRFTSPKATVGGQIPATPLPMEKFMGDLRSFDKALGAHHARTESTATRMARCDTGTVVPRGKNGTPIKQCPGCFAVWPLAKKRCEVCLCNLRPSDKLTIREQRERAALAKSFEREGV